MTEIKVEEIIGTGKGNLFLIRELFLDDDNFMEEMENNIKWEEVYIRTPLK